MVYLDSIKISIAHILTFAIKLQMNLIKVIMLNILKSNSKSR